MNDLRIFEHDSFGKIRTADIDGEPWFVGKDVAAALEYKDTVNALKAHVDFEDKRGWQITTPSGEQTMTVINESGLYSLVMSSKLPTARVFKRWVTSEVLPSIRKTGRYRVPEAEPVSRDDYLKAAAVVANCAEERLPLVLRILSQAGIPIATASKAGGGATNCPGDPDEKAVRLVLDFIRDNRERFTSGADGERYGFLRNGGETVFVFPAILYAELEKADYSPRKTMRYLAERDIIATHCYRDGKKHYTVPKHYGKGNVRVVEFHVSTETVTAQTTLPLP